MIYYAHSTENPDKSDWQELLPHLEAVADLSGKFAEAFHAKEWGHASGLLHDAGKATKDFIRRLEGASLRVNHSSFGARIAREHGGPLGILLS